MGPVPSGCSGKLPTIQNISERGVTFNPADIAELYYIGLYRIHIIFDRITPPPLSLSVSCCSFPLFSRTFVIACCCLVGTMTELTDVALANVWQADTCPLWAARPLGPSSRQAVFISCSQGRWINWMIAVEISFCKVGPGWAGGEKHATGTWISHFRRNLSISVDVSFSWLENGAKKWSEVEGRNRSHVMLLHGTSRQQNIHLYLC